MSPAKQKLLNLEKTGLYVFHGSGYDIRVLEPKQAHNHVGGKRIPDGAPAVFATSTIDYAIFMAIVNVVNCSEGSSSTAGSHTEKGKDPILNFGLTKETLDQLTDESSGFVYIFDKATFSQRDEGGVEYVSHDAVTPIGKVRVTRNDLPDDIKIIVRP